MVLVLWWVVKVVHGVAVGVVVMVGVLLWQWWWWWLSGCGMLSGGGGGGVVLGDDGGGGGLLSDGGGCGDLWEVFDLYTFFPPIDQNPNRSRRSYLIPSHVSRLDLTRFISR